MTELKQDIRLSKIMWLRTIIQDILYYRLNNYNDLLTYYVKEDSNNNKNESFDGKYNFKLRELNNDVISEIMLHVLKMDRYYSLYYMNDNKLTKYSYLLNSNNLIKSCDILNSLYNEHNGLINDLKMRVATATSFVTRDDNVQVQTDRYRKKCDTIDSHLFNESYFIKQKVDYYTLTSSSVRLYIASYIILELMYMHNCNTIQHLIDKRIINPKVSILDQVMCGRFTSNASFRKIINNISTLSETNQVNYYGIRPYRYPTTNSFYLSEDKYLTMIEYSSLSYDLLEYLDDFDTYNKLPFEYV